MIEVFGWVAAAFGVASSLPQLIRIIRAGTSVGVSLPLWQLTMGATASWAVHGYLVSMPQMLLPNVALVVASFGIMIFILRDRGQAIVPQLVLPLAVALALSGLNLAFGAVAFGFAVAVPQLIGQFAQTRELIVAPLLDGVSPGYLGIFLLVQGMWFIFGIGTTDWALIICAGSMVVICSINLTIYLVRRLRARSRVTLAV